ncbi:hypothetical protein [Shimia sp.]|uniref:hypothetical protein n=1 Tax=Shimia sp. TaxID=1954381 RepID=UPI003B8BB086
MIRAIKKKEFAMRWLAVVCAIWASQGAAQVTNYEADGNLESTFDVGCVPLSKLSNDYSPADLAGGVIRCFKDGQDDRAFELIVTMQLRTAFDTLRVEDTTAHQAGQVMMLEIQYAAGDAFGPRMQEAVARFGDSGSPRHNALCAQMAEVGPPTHSPRYMVQHGMAAFTEREGDRLLDDFDPEESWEILLEEYLQCG